MKTFFKNVLILIGCSVIGIFSLIKSGWPYYGLGWLYDNDYCFSPKECAIPIVNPLNSDSYRSVETVYWYEKAAEQGQLEAIRELGSMYLWGNGRPQDMSKAKFWLEQGVKQDDLKSMSLLGILYRSSRNAATNSTHNLNKAIHWLTKAAKLGDMEAQNQLATLYAEDNTSIKDTHKSLYWLNQSQTQYEAEAARGNAKSQWILGKSYADGYNENCNGYCIFPKNSHRAAYWLEKSAERLSAIEQWELGEMYGTGCVDPSLSCDKFIKNPDKAVYWLEKAAKDGSVEHQVRLAGMYASGCLTNSCDDNRLNSVDKIEERWKWEAPSQLGFYISGYDSLSSYLSDLVEAPEGDEFPEKRLKAIYWYKKAALQGSEEAQNQLGWYYASGKGLPKDFTRAYAWWNIASSNNDYHLAGKSRDLLAKEMAPLQVASAQELSFKLLKSIHSKTTN